MKIKVIVEGLKYSQSQSNAYALLLSEENGSRKLPIVIGHPEAQAIAIALEKDFIPPRPLTLDLFRSMFDILNIKLIEVIIHDLRNGIFYSNIVIENKNKVYSIDSRTSDAVALALRFNSPIYTHESILNQAGIILEDKNINEIVEKKSKKNSPLKDNKSISKISTKELSLKLKEAIEKENYELAAKYRDEINSRNNQNK